MNLLRPFSRSPLKGAETGIYLCTSPEVEGKTELDAVIAYLQGLGTALQNVR